MTDSMLPLLRTLTKDVHSKKVAILQGVFKIPRDARLFQMIARWCMSYL